MYAQKRSFALVVAAVAALAMAACSSTPPTTESGQVNNSPTTTTSPAPSPTATASKSSPAAPPAGAARQLGPFGLGVLHLGMTAADIRATGLVADFADPTTAGGCVFVPIKAAPKNTGSVVISADLGLAAINAWGSVATPEGLKLGDTYATVHATYPKWQGIEGHTGHGLVRVPGNSAANYRIDVDDNNHVRGLALQAVNQDCYE